MVSIVGNVMKKNKTKILLALFSTMVFGTCNLAHANNQSFQSNNLNDRYLMDLVDVQGLRSNKLIGYGLVVGLNGTGDKSQVKFTNQSTVNMLKQFGVQLSKDANPKLKNVAAVIVTAKVSPLSSQGQLLDITVSSLGDAKSLRGGTLIMTPLKGLDGQTYAVAQGNVVVGGISAKSRNGSSVVVNTPTVGRIPNGATLESSISSDFNKNPEVILNLKHPNFTTARNIENAINKVFGSKVAHSINYAKIAVKAPTNEDQRVTFMSLLDDVHVETGRTIPRVVFNSRTGTVVIGQGVKIKPAAIAHGNLTVTIKETPTVSQPNAALGNSAGKTVVTNESLINIDNQNVKAFVWPAGVELNDIVNAINAVGASPSDLMAILQSLKEVGALEADLVVI